jgi:ribonuclease HI
MPSQSKTQKPKPNPTAAAENATAVYIDGSGPRPDGTGAAYAWMRADTEGSHWQDRLTNNQAEYLALKSAVEALPRGAMAHVYTDSQLVCCQFGGKFKVRNPKLKELLSEIRDIIKERDLTVSVSWIPRGQNLANTLLESEKVTKRAKSESLD